MPGAGTTHGLTAVVLAAGRGRRLGDLTARQPKCMLQVGGRSLITRWLDRLEAAGARSITVVGGYEIDTLTRHVGQRCTVVANAEWDRGGPIVSLQAAADRLRGRPFVLANADVLVSEAALLRLVESRADAATLVDFASPRRAGEVNAVTHAGRVLRIGRRVPVEEADCQSIQVSQFGSIAGGRLLAECARLAPGASTDVVPSDALAPIAAAGQMAVVPVDPSEWDEIDTPTDYDRVRRSW